MSLVWVSPSKQQPFFWKVSLNSCLIGLDQLYTGLAGGSSREKPFNKILSLRSQSVPRGLVVTKRLVFFISYCSFVLLLYIAWVFLKFIEFPLYFPFNFLPFTRSPSRGLLKLSDDKRRNTYYKNTRKATHPRKFGIGFFGGLILVQGF